MNRIFISILIVFALVVIADASDLRDARDGKTYKTVMIGNQEWMAENLNYSVNPGKQSWCYDNDESNCSAYGRLYTWAAAVGKSEQQCGDGKECKLRGQVQGVCPAGWHLPSKEEFEELRSIAGQKAGNKDRAGNVLKSRSGWEDYDGESGNGTDAFGFAALPAGGYNSRIDNFEDEGEVAFFWSSTEYNSGSASYLDLYYYLELARVRPGARKFGGLSVRCIKN